MNETKCDSSNQCSREGTPVVEIVLVHTGNNRKIHTEETFIGCKKYDVAKTNKKGDTASF